MKRSTLIIFVVSMFFFAGCTNELNTQANNIKSDIESSAKGAYNAADKTVKSVERKVQQGKEAVDAVNTASEKIKAFQSE